MSLKKYYIINFVAILFSIICYSSIYSLLSTIFNTNNSIIYGIFVIFFQFFEAYNFTVIIIFSLIYPLLSYYYRFLNNIIVIYVIVFILAFIINNAEILSILSNENIMSINIKIGFFTIIIVSYILYSLLKKLL